jgi:hypothetical protein
VGDLRIAPMLAASVQLITAGEADAETTVTRVSGCRARPVYFMAITPRSRVLRATLEVCKIGPFQVSRVMPTGCSTLSFRGQPGGSTADVEVD